ncbi:hypothetical protein ABMA27_003484 [Loxostege sticticalis]|uniref:MADF domain-containing protein n=1 Tax=Loxostege sticticalis TaxID=481309 RepID=A0ABR3HT80_LOXSC
MNKHACSSSFNNENIIRLIQLYEFHPVLWDSTLTDYRNNDLRQDAWKAISNELKIPIGANDVYVSKWFASEYFTFLNDKDKPLPTTETTVSNYDYNASSSTQQGPSNASSSTQQAPSNASSSTQQQYNTSFRNKRPRRNNDDNATLTEAVGLLKHSAQYLSKQDDCYTSFGTHIAHELKKYDSRTFTLVKHAINNIIFQADMGQLPGQYGYYTGAGTNVTTSTSCQSNYSDIPIPQEPPGEAEGNQNELSEILRSIQEQEE